MVNPRTYTCTERLTPIPDEEAPLALLFGGTTYQVRHISAAAFVRRAMKKQTRAAAIKRHAPINELKRQLRTSCATSPEMYLNAASGETVLQY